MIRALKIDILSLLIRCRLLSLIYLVVLLYLEIFSKKRDVTGIGGGTSGYLHSAVETHGK